jgi:hypothetical protein
MTGEREAELLRHIPTLAPLAEAHEFRAELSRNREQMTAAVLTALRDRIDMLAAREAKR